MRLSWSYSCLTPRPYSLTYFCLVHCVLFLPIPVLFLSYALPYPVHIPCPIIVLFLPYTLSYSCLIPCRIVVQFLPYSLTYSCLIPCPFVVHFLPYSLTYSCLIPCPIIVLFLPYSLSYSCLIPFPIHCPIPSPSCFKPRFPQVKEFFSRSRWWLVCVLLVSCRIYKQFTKDNNKIWLRIGLIWASIFFY